MIFQSVLWHPAALPIYHTYNLDLLIDFFQIWILENSIEICQDSLMIWNLERSFALYCFNTFLTQIAHCVLLCCSSFYKPWRLNHPRFTFCCFFLRYGPESLYAYIHTIKSEKSVSNSFASMFWMNFCSQG